jgi:hypothetical protein
VKRFVFGALLVLVLPMASFAETGLSAKGLAKILNSKAAAKVLKDRSINSVDVRTMNDPETTGFFIAIQASEAGLSPAGPSTHPCMISISASRPKLDEKAPFTINAREVCAMSTPRMPVTAP